ncbi:Protein CBG27943 [Caenorhabditis briggsae]|uniref:Protein CBG27943 n=1 Tax=Caenorhabditis briggsae TaxID=6238 RepID=B6IJN5_CAEBR|nr:Protein CBG27943 [Caenorhabditis briggsae]CAS00115.1 Protein CBG27943 [Caenorhabditis briggsae]
MKVEDGNFYFDVLWETGETTVEPMSSLRKLSHVKLQEFYQTNESIAKECFFEKYCWRKGHHEGKAENENASNREEELGNLRGQEQSDGDDEHQVMVEQPIVEENLLTKEIKVELDPNDIHMNEPTENRDNENAAVPLQTAHSVTAAGTYKVRPASAPPSFRGESKASGLQEFQVKKKYTHRIEEILRYEKKPAPKVEITMDVWNAILNDARFEVPFEIEPDSDSEDEIESDEEDDVDSDSDYDESSVSSISEDAFVDIMTLDGVPTVADLSGQLPSNDQVLRAFSKILNITAQ